MYASELRGRLLPDGVVKRADQLPPDKQTIETRPFHDKEKDHRKQK